jgi:hypothetical protein
VKSPYETESIEFFKWSTRLMFNNRAYRLNSGVREMIFAASERGRWDSSEVVDRRACCENQTNQNHSSVWASHVNDDIVTRINRQHVGLVSFP